MPLEPFFSIQSPSFDIEHLGSYKLSIEISAEVLKIAVFQSQTLLVLEEYNLEKTKSYPHLRPELEEIFEGHLFLRANYWAGIHVCIESPILIKTSTDLFDTSHIPSYESIHFNENIGLEYSKFDVENTVFLNGFDQNLITFFTETYPSKNVEIKSSSETILLYCKENLASNSGILYFTESNLFAYFKINNKLSLATFTIQDFDKANFLETLKGVDKCILYGKITTFHSLFSTLNLIFKETTFGTFPKTFSGLNFSVEIPPYRYLSILI